MSTLLFFLTAIAVLVLSVRMIIKFLRHRSVRSTAKSTIIIIAAYAVIWLTFHLASSDQVVPLGTDVCFDDWCASITKSETLNAVGDPNHELRANGRFVILHIKMSNHARRIAQKPSEPRVHIMDANGHSWSYSEAGQSELEKTIGKQIGIDHRLELHESLETQLVFDVPADAKDLRALIEEGPFITKLLLADDRKIFPL